MYKTTFYGISGMQNPLPMLTFQFKVNIMFKSRWLSNAILKIELLNYIS